MQESLPPKKVSFLAFFFLFGQMGSNQALLFYEVKEYTS